MAPTENDIKSAANWSLLLGVLILILGFAALVVPPLLTALTANYTLAWIALLIGVLQLIHAYQTHKKGHDVAVPVDQIEERDGEIVLPGATKAVVKSLPGFDYSKGAK